MPCRDALFRFFAMLFTDYLFLADCFHDFRRRFALLPRVAAADYARACYAMTDYTGQ